MRFVSRLQVSPLQAEDGLGVRRIHRCISCKWRQETPEYGYADAGSVLQGNRADADKACGKIKMGSNRIQGKEYMI